MMKQITNSLDEISKDLFDGIIPDLQAWKVNDKDWLKNREREWAQFEKRLLKAGLKKSVVSKCKRYFVKGELTPFEDRIYVCMLLLVWFHPNKSEENWALIKKAIQNIGSDWGFANDHYKESTSLYGSAQSNKFSESEGFKQGFFMGDEVKLWTFLFGDDDGELFIKFDGETKLDKFFRFSSPFDGGIGMLSWLRNKNDKIINKWVIYQHDCYLEYWNNSLTDENLFNIFKTHPRARKPNPLRSVFKDYLSFVLGFDADTNPTYFKSVFVKKVRKILFERPLSETMQQILEEVKLESDVSINK